MDSHPYSYETSIFTLGAPHEEVQGEQTKLHPGFTLGKLVQPSPACRYMYLISLRFPHCSVQTVLMMSPRTSSQGSRHSSLFSVFAFFYKKFRNGTCSMPVSLTYSKFVAAVIKLKVKAGIIFL